MMKLVLVVVTFIVISIGTCHGFPEGLEDPNSTDAPQLPINGTWVRFNSDNEDLHLRDENDIVPLDNEDLHLRNEIDIVQIDNGDHHLRDENYIVPIDNEDYHLRDGNDVVPFDNEDLHLRNENEIVPSDNENQLLEDMDEEIAETRKGNSAKKILMLMKEIQKNQNSKLAGLTSAIAKLGSLRGDCPSGFFRCIPTNQCFKYFTDVKRNFTQASKKCIQHGLTLAQPVDPVSVRSYIVANYGKYPYNWLGAMGDNATVDWQRGGYALSNQEKTNYYNKPSVSSSYCLLMLSSSYYASRFPNKPYYSISCRYSGYTLCELTMQ